MSAEKKDHLVLLFMFFTVLVGAFLRCGINIVFFKELGSLRAVSVREGRYRPNVGKQRTRVPSGGSIGLGYTLDALGAQVEHRMWVSSARESPAAVPSALATHSPPLPISSSALREPLERGRRFDHDVNGRPWAGRATAAPQRPRRSS
jgi:hypothetical protein